MRVGVGKESVEAVLRCLGLCLDLKRVIACVAHIAEQQNGVERAIGWHVRRTIGKATERITCYPAARRRTSSVEVIPGYQDVRAAGTGIAGGQYKVADQLALDVHIPLLDPAQLEVCRLGIERARKCARGRRRRNGLKSAGKTKAGGRLSEHGGAVRGGKGAAGGGEGIGFAQEGRVLPQTLGSLTPG